MSEIIDYKFLLESLRKEIIDLQAINEYEVDRFYIDKKIKKSKALAYLVSVAIQVLDKVKLEEEIRELRSMVEELKQVERD